MLLLTKDFQRTCGCDLGMAGGGHIKQKIGVMGGGEEEGEKVTRLSSRQKWEGRRIEMGK